MALLLYALNGPAKSLPNLRGLGKLSPSLLIGKNTMAKTRVKYEGALTADDRKAMNDNFRDVSLCTTQFDAVTSTTGATLTNVVGMTSGTLQPGTYTFKVDASTVATANTGIKLAFKWGTASAITSALYVAKALTASGVVVTKSTTATDQTLILDSTAGVVIAAEVTGVIVVAVATTITLQAAQHTAHADTVSVFVNSEMEFTPVGATNPLSTATVF